MISRALPAGSNGGAATTGEATATRRLAAWQEELRDAIGSVGELLAALGLDDAPIAGASAPTAPSAAAARDFPLRVPRGFVARMRRRDPRDPLLLQVLPTAAEVAAAPGYTVDPL